MRLQACVFSTPLGCFGLVGTDRCVWRLTMGHARLDQVWQTLERHFQDESLIDADWNPSLKRKLEDFAHGRRVSFSDVRVQDDDRTQFQQRVLAATRRIPFGKTLSYGELAAEVGSPNAARAVGAVMASNHVPIIIPCHRVVGRHGELTGFSAPRGVSLKRQLLELEANAAQRR